MPGRPGPDLLLELDPCLVVHIVDDFANDRRQLLQQWHYNVTLSIASLHVSTCSAAVGDIGEVRRCPHACHLELLSV